MDIKNNYFKYVKNIFPNLSDNSFELLSDNLFSPYTLTLPNKIKSQVENISQQLFTLRENTDYQKWVLDNSPPNAQYDPGNYSICMSYDFHVDSNENLKLIEVNTNASFLAMGYYFYHSQGVPLPFSNFSIENLKSAIEEEAKGTHCDLSTIGIVDENPSMQRLYFEFLLYQQMFNSWGFKTTIWDTADLAFQNQKLFSPEGQLDFVYNRSTDFYLETPLLKAVKESYLTGSTTLSPNPHEYALLADKNRLIEWSLFLQDTKSPFYSILEPIQDNLLKTVLLTEENSSDIWQNKKKYFFKPLTSFGAKGAFRGESISKKYFLQLLEEKSLAQEYCPAAEQEFSKPNYPNTSFKYDLRFYVYKNSIQLGLARLYQGQMTNLKTPLGGFAPIKFI